MNLSTPKMKTFECVKCEEKFCSESKLRVHSRTHEERPKSRFPFECSICQRRFNHSGTLNYHLRTHETNPNLRSPFPCLICPKRFSRNYELKRHLRTHADSKWRYPFKCGICQKKFGIVTSLVSHFRNHEKVDKLRSSYSCGMGQCQKGFNTLAELKQHFKVCEGKYLYVCDVCSTSFSTPQELHNHSRIHDRSFDCCRCGLKFQEENNLDEHMMVHFLTDDDPNPVFKNQFTQLKSDTIVSKQSVSGPTSGKSKIFFHNSNTNTQLMGPEGKPKAHVEEQFTPKNLKHNGVMSVGHLCIQKNVCDDELSSELSFKCHMSELEPHSNLKSSVECNICKGCFRDSQFLVKHLQLVHGISSQFDLHSNKTGLEENSSMNEYSNIVSNEYPLVHNVCSRRFSSEGYLKSPFSRSSKSPSKYEEEDLLNAPLESWERFIQEEESSINSKEKNTYIHSMCQEENPKLGEEQQYMKNNLKGGTVIQQSDLCIDELTSGPSSRHQNTELESNWSLNSSVEFNFEQRFYDTQSSVGHHGLVDSRSTLTELGLDPNRAELQDIKDYLKEKGFQF